jgi:hypothetical protein
MTRSAMTAGPPRAESRVRTVRRTACGLQPRSFRVIARLSALASAGLLSCSGEGTNQGELGSALRYGVQVRQHKKRRMLR